MKEFDSRKEDRKMKKSIPALMILCLLGFVLLTGCGASDQDALKDKLKNAGENVEEQAAAVAEDVTEPVASEEADEPEEIADGAVADEQEETADGAVADEADDFADAYVEPVRLPEPSGEKVPVDAATRKKMNIFLSNFSEAGLFAYDQDDPDWQEIYRWVRIWIKINKWELVKYEELPGSEYSTYETISLDDFNKITDKYLGLTITDAQAKAEFSEPDEIYEYFYENGKFYVPAADGESYTNLSIVSEVEELDDQKLKLTFTVYEQDLDAYFDGKDKAEYYVLSSSDAANNPELEAWITEYAIVRTEGSSFKLERLVEK